MMGGSGRDVGLCVSGAQISLVSFQRARVDRVSLFGPNDPGAGMKK